MPETLGRDMEFLDLTETLGKLEVASRLSATASALRKQADGIDKDLKKLGIQDVVAPEGYCIPVRAAKPGYPMHVETKEPIYGGTGWAQIFPHFEGGPFDQRVYGRLVQVDETDRFYFHAKYATFSPDGKVWFYNERQNVRVLLEEGVSQQGIQMIDEAESGSSS